MCFNAICVHLHQLVHLKPFFILLLQGEVFGDEEVLWRLWVQSGPSHVVEVVAVEEVVLLLSGAVEVEVEDLAGVVVLFLALDKNIDTHPLHDIEHVLVFAAVSTRLFLAGVAVQAQYVDLVEGVHEALAHWWSEHRRCCSATCLFSKCGPRRGQ